MGLQQGELLVVFWRMVWRAGARSWHGVCGYGLDLLGTGWSIWPLEAIWKN